jgi:putative ABC transport system substrate-binding protein
VAVFGDTDFPGNATALQDTKLSAKALGVQLQYLDVRIHKGIETLFRAATEAHSEVALVFGGPFLTSQRSQLARFAVQSRIPTMNPAPIFVQVGGLLAYGVNRRDLFRRAATYVDKILKGAKPADLPVEQPMKFEFVINLQTAKQMGLTIPQWTLMKADRVIK